MTNLVDKEVGKVLRLAWHAWDLLANEPPETRGAVLDRITAAWLKGYLSQEPTRAATRKIREKALQAHLDAVWKIVDDAAKDEWSE